MLTLNQSNCRWQEIPTHRKRGQARQKSHLRLFSLLTLGLEYSISASLISCFATQMPHISIASSTTTALAPHFTHCKHLYLPAHTTDPQIPTILLPVLSATSFPFPHPLLFTSPLSLLINIPNHSHPKSQTPQAYCTLNTYLKFFSAADFQHFQLVAAGLR